MVLPSIVYSSLSPLMLRFFFLAPVALYCTRHTETVPWILERSNRMMKLPGDSEFKVNRGGGSAPIEE